jgi:hypothetical protein
VIRARFIFASGAVTLSAALAASFFTSSQESTRTAPTKKSVEQTPQVTIPAELKDSDVLTWDCEIPEYKPETILLTCADGGWMIHKIRWNTWGIKGATGTGYFSENLCEPSCAEGKRVEEKVNVKLSQLTPYKGKFYLRTLDINTVSGKDFWWGRADGLEWDVMEFAEMMTKSERG